MPPHTLSDGCEGDDSSAADSEQDERAVAGQHAGAESSSARLPGTGNCSARASSCVRTSTRLFRVSASSRITDPIPPSRIFGASRRSRACTSRGRVSASTPIACPSTASTASHARRSPGIGSGTSVRHRTERWRRTRRRLSSARWAASRTGSPDGYARTESSGPTAAQDRQVFEVWCLDKPPFDPAHLRCRQPCRPTDVLEAQPVLDSGPPDVQPNCGPGGPATRPPAFGRTLSAAHRAIVARRAHRWLTGPSCGS